MITANEIERLVDVQVAVLPEKPFAGSDTRPAAPLPERIRYIRFYLQLNEISIYDPTRVDQWLRAKARGLNGRVRKPWRVLHRPYHDYDRPIPSDVIDLAVRLQKDLSGLIRLDVWEVTDRVRTDPFLVVRPWGILPWATEGVFPVAYWDEAGF